MGLRQDRVFSRLLDTDGDGTGIKNANIDANATDYPGGATFFLQPAAGEIMVVNRMLVQIRDTGNIQAELYGAAAALTTGLTVRTNSKSGVVSDLTDGVPIQTNADWGRACYDVTATTFAAGDQFLLVRWTFGKSGRALILDGNKKERLEVVMPEGDDASGLIQHYFNAQGFYKQTA